MKKLFVLLLAGLMLALGLASCGSKTCKEDGCDLETYKKGYCALHYAMNYPEEALKDAQDQLGDLGLDLSDLGL